MNEHWGYCVTLFGVRGHTLGRGRSLHLHLLTLDTFFLYHTKQPWHISVTKAVYRERAEQEMEVSKESVKGCPCLCAVRGDDLKLKDDLGLRLDYLDRNEWGRFGPCPPSKVSRVEEYLSSKRLDAPFLITQGPLSPYMSPRWDMGNPGPPLLW